MKRVDNIINSLSYELNENEADTINNIIRSLKKRRSLVSKQSKFIKQLKVSSDKKWTFYSESLNEESGITKYDKDNPIVVSFDTVFPLNDSRTLIAEVEKYKKEVISKVKKLRKIRKNISLVEKEYS